MKKITLAGVGALGITTLIGSGGVLAADGTLSQTDTVVVTVQSNCSLATSNTSGNDYTATIANGAFNTNITGSTFTVTCNDTGGWELAAVGYTNNTEGTTYMDASTGDTDDDIQTGTTLDGSASNWAVKFVAGGSDAPTVVYANDTFANIPGGTGTVIATGGSTAGNATVAATYGVGISSTQSAGTYTGKVLYTLAHPMTVVNTPVQNDPAPVVNPSPTDGGKSGGSTDSGKGDDKGSDNKGGDSTEEGSGEKSGAKSGDTTSNVTNNNVSNYYSNLLTTNSTTNNTTNNSTSGGSGYSGGSGNDSFATVDELDTSDKGDEKGDEEEETEDTYEAPLGVTSSSSDGSSTDSGMETGFLVALGAAAVAGVATYALIRKQDSEE